MLTKSVCLQIAILFESILITHIIQGVHGLGPGKSETLQDWILAGYILRFVLESNPEFFTSCSTDIACTGCCTVPSGTSAAPREKGQMVLDQ